MDRDVRRLVALLLGCVPGCAWVVDLDRFSVAEADASVDGGVDAMPDASVDGGVDAMPDTSVADGGTDGCMEQTDAALDAACPNITYSEGPVADVGAVCNLDGVRSLDGVGARLARTRIGGPSVMDGESYTACVRATFENPVESVAIVIRSVESACGSACAGILCSGSTSANVFADGRFVRGVTPPGEFERYSFDVGGACVIHVCRDHSGIALPNLEVDWIGVPGCGG